jgi:hypothetical protein
MEKFQQEEEEKTKKYAPCLPDWMQRSYSKSKSKRRANEKVYGSQYNQRNRDY